MRTLVTGGGGFMGSHLVESLHGAGWDVVVLDRGVNPHAPPPAGVRFVRAELADRGLLRGALEGVEVVFHFAWTGVHVASNEDLRTHAELNLLSSLSLFETCCEMGVRRVIFVSSGGTVYGEARHLPIDESHPTHPICAYGVTKLAVEHYLALLGRLHGLEYVVLRPSVAYGERQNPDGAQGAVAVFCGRILRGEPIVVWGDGTAVRDFFYIGDFVEACRLAATRPVSGEIFNCSGGRGISLNELLDLLGRISGREVEVRHEAARSFDVPELVLDISKAERLLGWVPRTRFEDGVARTWAWIERYLSSEGISDGPPPGRSPQ